MAKKAFVTIKLKEEVLDPQGKAVLSVLESSGYRNVSDVRIGKYVELTIKDAKGKSKSGSGDKSLEDEIREISDKVLSNPLMEEFSVEIK